MDNDQYQSAFDQIIELNHLDFSAIEEEFDTVIESEIKEMPYEYFEAAELNHALATVLQQVSELIIDMTNEEEIGWLDESGAMMLRHLYDVCEDVIGKVYSCECDCEDCEFDENGEDF